MQRGSQTIWRTNQTHSPLRPTKLTRAHAPCRSQPAPRIPTTRSDQIYDIKYYSRDVRRSGQIPEASIDEAFKLECEDVKLLVRPEYVEDASEGSPGNKVRSALVEPTCDCVRAHGLIAPPSSPNADATAACAEPRRAEVRPHGPALRHVSNARYVCTARGDTYLTVRVR